MAGSNTGASRRQWPLQAVGILEVSRKEHRPAAASAAQHWNVGEVLVARPGAASTVYALRRSTGCVAPRSAGYEPSPSTASTGSVPGRRHSTFRAYSMHLMSCLSHADLHEELLPEVARVWQQDLGRMGIARSDLPNKLPPTLLHLQQPRESFSNNHTRLQLHLSNRECVLRSTGMRRFPHTHAMHLNYYCMVTTKWNYFVHHWPGCSKNRPFPQECLHHRPHPPVDPHPSPQVA